MSAIRKLVNTNLVNANFLNANFLNANFANANFANANFANANFANVNSLQSIATNQCNKTVLPLPIPMELELKPYVEVLQELIKTPPPYCPLCNSFTDNISCNKLIQPKSCPLNRK